MVEPKGRSLTETPTWAVAAVISIMVTLGFFFHGLLKHFGKWLDRTKRKALLAALEKIKEELMLFGLLSLLMGHWVVYVAKICVETPGVSSKFYSCLPDSGLAKPEIVKHFVSSPNQLNYSVSRVEEDILHNDFCPEGEESFASYESLEQLHRFLFVLGITHVSYSFIAITLAMIKIYSWREWENQAKAVAELELQGSPRAVESSVRMRRLSTFISHHTSHPWSQHRVFVWLLCFSRQFWSSISQADYLALRLGFITTHQLPLSYDFHNYMVRSMEEEFCDIVGISVPLWIFGILCIFLGFHGTNIYFWLSFLPALLILSIGTKLHHVVVKLAVGIMDVCPVEGFHHFNLRDELFWFRKPKLLLRAIQFISFQNAFEMALFVWSLWESSGPSCFMDNRSFIVIRLSFGLVSQFWCSFITFPLSVIVAQMGSRFKKSIIPKRARSSLRRWRKRARTRHGGGSTHTLLGAVSTASSESALDEMERIRSMEGGEITTPSNLKQQVPPFTGPCCDGYDNSSSDDDEHSDEIHVKDSSSLLLP